ncbi:GH14968 [Drosophila grimshawi]|uniref:GH14968 n=2 Tax=Drosophila grimshawi TaxID=7222 RepID=B4JUU9_DROGR|nr:GH14968 [Drosophila grimshawi]
MTANGMKIMRCGHALCNACYSTCRLAQTTCPYCYVVVFQLTKVGDDCVICCEPMLKNTMTYMNCEHALHTACLSAYRRHGFRSCPLCQSPLGQN